MKMKFDHIIMNPPFCRNLHLKILNEAICYSYDIVSHNNGIFIKGKTVDGKYWKEALYKTKTCSDSRVPLGIYFATKEEAENFIKWSDTKTIKYFVKQIVVDQHIYTDYLPFMPDYTHPWTDKDLYEYFNLTPEEIAIIENEV